MDFIVMAEKARNYNSVWCTSQVTRLVVSSAHTRSLGSRCRAHPRSQDSRSLGSRCRVHTPGHKTRGHKTRGDACIPQVTWLEVSRASQVTRLEVSRAPQVTRLKDPKCVLGFQCLPQEFVQAPRGGFGTGVPSRR
ncbi:hypothetical protein DPMN_018206 [Dreissena polymorpha]|uniref:Uncharacterized protein n=1 Tax=Dreissena polymorpha TaxID=45954 RepID=A0A9D4NIB0_DREPO|nr:hypothetical protein DPMN_018206 [Dreissena polymorpha]